MIRTLVIFDLNTGNIQAPTGDFSEQTAEEVRRDFEKTGRSSKLLEIIEIDVDNKRHEPQRRLVELIAKLDDDPAVRSVLAELIGKVYKADRLHGKDRL